MQRATHSAREKFVATIQQHAGGDAAQRYSFAQRLMRYGATYGRIAERECNGHQTWDGNWDEKAAKRDEEKAASIEAAVTKLCAAFDCKPDFQGDPRGNILKIVVPDGHTDDWGNTGVCVPTS